MAKINHFDRKQHHLIKRSQKVWELKIVLLITKICRTFCDNFDFDAWTILLGIDMPYIVRQYARVVEWDAFMWGNVAFQKSHLVWWPWKLGPVEHTTVMVSTGVGTAHINKGKFRVITIKHIYLTNSGCFSHVHKQKQSLLYPCYLCYASQIALVAGASTGHEMPLLLQVHGESCLDVCYWLYHSISIWASDDFKHSMTLKSRVLAGQGSTLVTFIESCMP